MTNNQRPTKNANANYRLIAVSILDGSTYDIVEFRDWQALVKHAQAITRFDIHCFAVDISGDIAMSTLIRTGKDDA